MKKKEIYLVMAASVLVVAGWAAWRFTAINKVAEPPTNATLPAQQSTPVTKEATPATSHRTTGRPIVSAVIETPEMKKARVSAEITHLLAKSKPLTEAYQAGGITGMRNAHKDLSKPEDMAFLKSLGLSGELRDKVYQMLRAKGDLSSDQQEKMMETLRRGEVYTADARELRQMHADLEAAVGTENYGKIKYYESTPVERLQTAQFKDYLQSRSLPLTEQQEAAVVEAMRQARAGSGKATFSLRAREISMEDKLAYIDTVKQSLAPVLNANDMAHLEQHLKEVAESPLKTQARIESIQKRAEERKSNASNLPAAPR